ncbi:SPOR domain-containing protein [Vibrio methylphosphonaticus]|uniref:SPOR domain-containing protein n=1 Tax=Vibrio methylphosphonaticus TaxID=2946866 RepID=UPI00202A56BC|nr:SPOR domain-containing protein [Vibrio methylphosphonaticus]MCL9774270.1 SPOR domain-containing protein [Vibrio methylphosphonaticus]
MASKFQSRLIGTIVLVAVGVIILPDLLDGKKLHYKEEFASIPLKPELSSDVESFEILEPEDASEVLPDSPVMATVGETMEEEAQSDVVDVSIQEVPERNDYADSAWIIQLMALKNAENARGLVADLQKRGYQAHVKQESNFTRVIIGPDVSKSKLETQLVELEKITGSRGQLLKFKPLNP